MTTPFGRRPDCALYYVGWNDLRSAGLPHLDSGYADYHLRSQIDALKVRRISVDFYTPSPLLTMSIRWLSIAVDTARPVAEPAGPMLDNPDTRLEALFDRNIATISAHQSGPPHSHAVDRPATEPHSLDRGGIGGLDYTDQKARRLAHAGAPEPNPAGARTGIGRRLSRHSRRAFFEPGFR